MATALKADRRRGEGGPAIYRALTGHEPADAVIDDDRDFDRHVLASLIAVAAAEDGAVDQRLGLAPADFSALIERWFPAQRGRFTAGPGRRGGPEDDEVAMVRELLLAKRSTAGPDGAWLAAMIARRAVEPNHLWEDLGLRDRAELSRLMVRHFAPLAARNSRHMRWKRFFYRMLCEDDGFVMCTTPVCTECGDFELCFGEETGESRLARARRAVALVALS